MSDQLPPRDLTLIDINEVCRMTSLGPTTVTRMCREGIFPERHHITARTTRWLKAEVEAWISEKINARKVA